MTVREPEFMVWKRRGAEHVRRQVEGMSSEEELEFWRKRTEKMRARQRAARSECSQSVPQDQPPNTSPVADSRPRWSDSDIALREPECVALKRRGQERVQRLLEGMTKQEELEFWRQRTQKTRTRQQARPS